MSKVGKSRSFLLFEASRIQSERMNAAFNDEQPGVNPFCILDWVGAKMWLCLVLITCSKIFNRTGVTVIPL